MAGKSKPALKATLPEGLAAWIAPGRTALLLVDIQVDFASPEGAAGGWGADLSAVPAAVAASERLVAAARAAGASVVFVALATRGDRDSAAWRERMRRRGAPDDSGLCREGTPGAAFHGPEPQEGEPVVRKTRYSGFAGTDLDGLLKARGVDTLVVCGLTTDCCVDCTVRDAFHLDYHVFIATDACASYDAGLHAGALKALDLNCAILCTTDEAVRAWRGAR